MFMLYLAHINFMSPIVILKICKTSNSSSRIHLYCCQSDVFMTRVCECACVFDITLNVMQLILGYLLRRMKTNMGWGFCIWRRPYCCFIIVRLYTITVHWHCIWWRRHIHLSKTPDIKSRTKDLPWSWHWQSNSGCVVILCLHSENQLKLYLDD